MRGESLGALHGLPFSAKDLISVAGLPYASGSRAMKGNVGKVDAPSVERAKAVGETELTIVMLVDPKST